MNALSELCETFKASIILHADVNHHASDSRRSYICQDEPEVEQMKGTPLQDQIRQEKDASIEFCGTSSARTCPNCILATSATRMTE